MAKRITLERQQERPKRRRRVLGPLIFALVALALLYLGIRHFQKPSTWMQYQKGLPFALILPQPMPPGMNIESVEFTPANAPRQQVEKVTITMFSGPDRLTIVEQPDDHGAPLPTTDGSGRKLDNQSIGLFRVYYSSEKGQPVLHFAAMGTRVVLRSATLTRLEMNNVVGAMKTVAEAR